MRTLLYLLVVGVALSAGPALAADGVIEINQAAVLEGGVTPSDTPGFPVTLDASGSYILTGNLVVPNTNTTAIDTAGVTLSSNLLSIQSMPKHIARNQSHSAANNKPVSCGSMPRSA